ncbi:MAG TPA: hypothetical protein VHI78_07520 [Bacteroidales bacterium]|jgi:hypothetical protein|nr:hypothetical protein [Bacteroidales bacterium]
MKKSLAAFLFLSLPILTFSQKAEPENIIQESILSLNQGIYMNIEEFLTNNPSIPYRFEVHNSLADYYIHPDERNDYVISYRDDMGYLKVLGAREIWGYCDGKSVFVSFQGRPYEMIHLGAISVLRYQQLYHRTTIAQILSLYALGHTVVSMERSQDVLFHIKTNRVIIPTGRNIRKFIEGDPELYADYTSIKNMDYFEKNLIYLQKYNEKYPLIISASGIATSEPPVTDDLVEKQPL